MEPLETRARLYSHDETDSSLATPSQHGGALTAATSVVTNSTTSTPSSPARPSSSTVVAGDSNPTKSSTQARRLYRTAANESLSVTREIAALDFLVGIPLEAEGKIVREGWVHEQQILKEESKTADSEEESNTSTLEAPTSLQGKWWEKWIKSSNDPSWSQSDPLRAGKPVGDRDDAHLERPEAVDRQGVGTGHSANKTSVWQAYAPGRRLEGDDAYRIKIPLTTKTLTKQKSIARQAALREWESQTAHGLVEGQDGPPLLDGRIFFSAAGAYPVSVFSMIRYEPRKEEQQLRRQKLEALGGGGSQFVLPFRDWRGVSYRSLLPRKGQHTSAFFDRFRSDGRDSNFVDFKREGSDNDDDDSSTSSCSSDDSDVYQPGLLDDPEMVQGRHRHVMIGDRASGPMVSSTIQFVKPDILKAELNKQFRERFDGWEPPRGARKYIGARVMNGEYRLMDPTLDEYSEEALRARSGHKHQGSVHSTSSATENNTVATAAASAASTLKDNMQIRMPPSLTLSKIRSLKHQALIAAVKARLEIGTVALAAVHFERLCLDCRVDKSNRRLTFAVCLLLAAKLNEPNVGLASHSGEEDDTQLHSLVRPNQRSSNMFESLLGFFTQEWNLSLKRIFDAEWGVFAALGFSLHANPSHVSFHFKRMMKTLEWNIRDYLGRTMHDQWIRALEVEDDRQRDREKRKERKRREREQRILSLRIEIENEVIRKQLLIKAREEEGKAAAAELSDVPPSPSIPNDDRRKTGVARVKSGGMRLLSRMRRVTSKGHLAEGIPSVSEHSRRRFSGHASAHQPSSIPVLHSVSAETATGLSIENPDSIAIDIPSTQTATPEESSIGSVTMESDRVLEV
jgi:hypothetical protein